MTTDGKVGEAPDWYQLITAARYLGVAPWELMKQPLLWTHWALTAKGAEYEAAEGKRAVAESQGRVQRSARRRMR